MAIASLRTVVVLACAVGLAGVAALDSARASLVRLNPALAAQLPASDGVKVDLLGALLGQPDKMPARAEVFATARSRLRSEPLDSEALNVMAYAADPEGRKEEARRYADLATRISKRTVFSQLAMTYDAVVKNDVSGAVGRFDAILRARPDTSSLFFPRLKAALKEEELRLEIARIASAGSPWAMDFLVFATGPGEQARYVSDVATRAGKAVPEDQRNVYFGPIVSRSFDAGDYAGARKLAALIPGGSSSMFDSPVLSKASLDPKYGAAAWSLPSNPTASASAVEENGQPALSVYATGGAHVVVASKRLMLAPGRYTLRHDLTSGSAPAEGTTVRWNLVCIGSAGIFESSSILVGRTNSRRLGPIEVPAGCPAQRLDLDTDVTFGDPAIAFTVSKIALDRTAPTR